MKHAYVVTEKIPGIENMPNVRDHDASVYLKLQGDALQVGGYEVDPIFIEKVSNIFHKNQHGISFYNINYFSLKEILHLVFMSLIMMSLVFTLKGQSTEFHVLKM